MTAKDFISQKRRFDGIRMDDMKRQTKLSERMVMDRVRVFKALAHHTRLQMLEAISEREQCVCELQQLIGADMSTVSKHLALLKQAGMVTDEKRGTWVYYRLLCPCLKTFMECVDSVLKKPSPKGKKKKKTALCLVI